MQIQKEREYSLDFCKFIATVLIIFHHYQQSFSGDYTAIKFYGGAYYFGHLVELFFILSGYFALHMVEAKNAGGQLEPFHLYGYKRLRRLIPVLTAAALADQLFRGVYQAVIGTPLGAGLKLWGFVTAALGIQSGGAFVNQSINNPTWYVCILLICYVVLYVLTWLSKRLRISSHWLYIAMIFAGASLLTAEVDAPFFRSTTNRGYTAFFTGVCLGKLLAWKPLHKKKGVVAAAAGFLVLFFYLYKHRFYTVQGDIRFLHIFMVWPALVIVLKAPFMKKLFRGNFWSVLAAVAFNAYIWHGNVLKIFRFQEKYLNTDWHYSLGAMLAATVISFGVGVLSHYLIEKPASAYLDKKLLGSARGKQ